MSRLSVSAGALGLFVTMASQVSAATIATRFGSLSTDSQNTLLFNGRPVTPTIQGNNSLSLLKVIQVGAADNVIVQDNGGSGCPSQYYVVAVTGSGAMASKAFGTCNDLASVSRKGNGVSLTMPAFVGHGQQGMGGNAHHTFDVVDGVVTENGKR